MDNVVEQGDFMENSVLESLRKAEVAVNNFLRSNPYLMMRLGKHQEVCEAAMDIEQEDFTKNFGFESLRKADIMVGNFLRSDHSIWLAANFNIYSQTPRRTSNHLHNLHRAKVEARAGKKSLQVAALSANRVGTVP